MYVKFEHIGYLKFEHKAKSINFRKEHKNTLTYFFSSKNVVIWRFMPLNLRNNLN